MATVSYNYIIEAARLHHRYIAMGHIKTRIEQSFNRTFKFSEIEFETSVRQMQKMAVNQLIIVTLMLSVFVAWR